MAEAYTHTHTHSVHGSLATYAKRAASPGPGNVPPHEAPHKRPGTRCRPRSSGPWAAARLPHGVCSPAVPEQTGHGSDPRCPSNH